MTNVGTAFKQVRKNKDLTLDEVEQETRIKSEFIDAIENINWHKLPEYPVVAGFVKNLSSFYGIDRNKMIALLRRDYIHKAVPLSPKPDLQEKRFVWKPKFTFILGVVAIVLFVGGYLAYQYFSFSRPPSLEIFVPNENQIVYQRNLTVTGKTSNDSVVIVNNQPALVQPDGTFRAEIIIDENTSQIEIKATSRSERETIEIRNIQVELDN